MHLQYLGIHIVRNTYCSRCVTYVHIALQIALYCVQFLQDTLDSLFEILVQNAEQYRKLVFDVLVSVHTYFVLQY